MTVAELITILQTLPQDAIVRMSMNDEYECKVEPDMVYECENARALVQDEHGRHVRIDSEGQDSWA